MVVSITCSVNNDKPDQKGELENKEKNIRNVL